MDEIKQIVTLIVSSTIGAGAIGWLFKSQFKSGIASAVTASEIATMKKDIEDARAEAKEIKENYLTRFEGLGKHVTTEVNRVLEETKEDRKEVTKIKLRCIAFHPELVE